MLKFGYILLVITACSCRYIDRPTYHHSPQPYSPYTDYSDDVSYVGGYSIGNTPYHHYPYHMPSYLPPGTYFDQRRGVLRPLTGGGVPILVDYHKRCSGHYVGLKPHPEESQYYYVCKPDCVIFAKCQRLQNFNAANGQCVQNTHPEYVPVCKAVGRFPIYADCHLYYKCDASMKPQIYSCPHNKIFCQKTSKCIPGNKCIPTQIAPNDQNIPNYCENKYPPCMQNGVFRSPSDCSLYYTCALQKHKVYLQTRFKCPDGTFYDLQSNACLPESQVPCDCIRLAELVYPQTHLQSYHPRPLVHSSDFDLDYFKDTEYLVESFEQDDDEDVNNSSNCSEECGHQPMTPTLQPAAEIIPDSNGSNNEQSNIPAAPENIESRVNNETQTADGDETNNANNDQSDDLPHSGTNDNSDDGNVTPLPFQTSAESEILTNTNQVTAEPLITENANEDESNSSTGDTSSGLTDGQSDASLPHENTEGPEVQPANLNGLEDDNNDLNNDGAEDIPPPEIENIHDGETLPVTLTEPRVENNDFNKDQTIDDSEALHEASGDDSNDFNNEKLVALSLTTNTEEPDNSETPSDTLSPAASIESTEEREAQPLDITEPTTSAPEAMDESISTPTRPPVTETAQLSAEASQQDESSSSGVTNNESENENTDVSSSQSDPTESPSSEDDNIELLDDSLDFGDTSVLSVDITKDSAKNESVAPPERNSLDTTNSPIPANDELDVVPSAHNETLALTEDKKEGDKKVETPAAEITIDDSPNSGATDQVPTQPTTEKIETSALGESIAAEEQMPEENETTSEPEPTTLDAETSTESGVVEHKPCANMQEGTQTEPLINTHTDQHCPPKQLHQKTDIQDETETTPDESTRESRSTVHDDPIETTPTPSTATTALSIASELQPALAEIENSDAKQNGFESKQDNEQTTGQLLQLPASKEIEKGFESTSNDTDFESSLETEEPDFSSSNESSGTESTFISNVETELEDLSSSLVSHPLPSTDKIDSSGETLSDPQPTTDISPSSTNNVEELISATESDISDVSSSNDLPNKETTVTPNGEHFSESDNDIVPSAGTSILSDELVSDPLASLATLDSPIGDAQPQPSVEPRISLEKDDQVAPEPLATTDRPTLSDTTDTTLTSGNIVEPTPADTLVEPSISSENDVDKSSPLGLENELLSNESSKIAPTVISHEEKELESDPLVPPISQTILPPTTEPAVSQTISPAPAGPPAPPPVETPTQSPIIDEFQSTDSTIAPTLQPILTTTAEPSVSQTIPPAPAGPPAPPPVEKPTQSPEFLPDSETVTDEVQSNDATIAPTTQPILPPTAEPPVSQTIPPSPAATPAPPLVETPTQSPIRSVSQTIPTAPAGPPAPTPVETHTQSPAVSPESGSITDEVQSNDTTIAPTTQPILPPTAEPSVSQTIPPAPAGPPAPPPVEKPTQSPEFLPDSETVTDEVQSNDATIAPSTQSIFPPTAEPSVSQTIPPAGPPAPFSISTPIQSPAILPESGTVLDEFQSNDATIAPTSQPILPPVTEASVSQTIPPAGPPAPPSVETPTQTPIIDEFQSNDSTIAPTSQPIPPPTTEQSVSQPIPPAPAGPPAPLSVETPTQSPGVLPESGTAIDEVQSTDPTIPPTSQPILPPTAEPSVLQTIDPALAGPPATFPVETPTQSPIIDEFQSNDPTIAPTSQPILPTAEEQSVSKPSPPAPAGPPAPTSAETLTQSPATLSESETAFPSNDPTIPPTSQPILPPTAEPSVSQNNSPAPTGPPAPFPIIDEFQSNDPTIAPISQPILSTAEEQSVSKPSPPAPAGPPAPTSVEMPTQSPATLSESETAFPSTDPTIPPTSQPILPPTAEPSVSQTSHPAPAGPPAPFPIETPTQSPIIDEFQSNDPTIAPISQPILPTAEEQSVSKPSPSAPAGPSAPTSVETPTQSPAVLPESATVRDELRLNDHTNAPSTQPILPPTAEPSVSQTIPPAPAGPPTPFPIETPTQSPIIDEFQSNDPTIAPASQPILSPAPAGPPAPFLVETPTQSPAVLPESGTVIDEFQSNDPTIAPTSQPILPPTAEPFVSQTIPPAPAGPPVATPVETPTQLPIIDEFQSNDPTITQTSQPILPTAEEQSVSKPSPPAPAGPPAPTSAETPTQSPATLSESETAIPSTDPTIPPTSQPILPPTAEPSVSQTIPPAPTEPPAPFPVETPTQSPLIDEFQSNDPTIAPTSQPILPTAEEQSVSNPSPPAPAGPPAPFPIETPIQSPIIDGFQSNDPTVALTSQPILSTAEEQSVSKPSPPAPAGPPAQTSAETPTQSPATLSESETAFPSTDPTIPPTSQPILPPTAEPSVSQTIPPALAGPPAPFPIETLTQSPTIDEFQSNDPTIAPTSQPILPTAEEQSVSKPSPPAPAEPPATTSAETPTQSPATLSESETAFPSTDPTIPTTSQAILLATAKPSVSQTIPPAPAGPPAPFPIETPTQSPIIDEFQSNDPTTVPTSQPILPTAELFPTVSRPSPPAPAGPPAQTSAETPTQSPATLSESETEFPSTDPTIPPTSQPILPPTAEPSVSQTIPPAPAGSPAPFPIETPTQSPIIDEFQSNDPTIAPTFQPIFPTAEEQSVSQPIPPPPAGLLASSPAETQPSPTTEHSVSSDDDYDLDEDEIRVLDDYIIMKDNVVTDTTKPTSMPHPAAENAEIYTTAPKYYENSTPQYNENTAKSITHTYNKNKLTVHLRHDPCLETGKCNTTPPKITTDKDYIHITTADLETSKPVINSNSHQIAKPTTSAEVEKGNMPRLEIIAERPMDVHFVVCPKTCTKDHKHKYDKSDRAVLLRWYPNRSKQTMGLETSNQIKTGGEVVV